MTLKMEAQNKEPTMKRHLCLSILIAASTLATPAVFAGSDIVKCVDDGGRVTLTDQPCDGGAATVRLASTPVVQADEAETRTEVHPRAAEQATLPPPPVSRRHVPPRLKVKPLMRDVATLKEARAQFLLADTGTRHRFATLD